MLAQRNAERKKRGEKQVGYCLYVMASQSLAVACLKANLPYM